MPFKDPERYREYQRRYQPRYKREHPEDARKWAKVARHNQDAKGELGRWFYGIDGEGYTDEETGIHHYMMMVAADSTGTDSVLYTGNPLSTEQCLWWMLDLRDLIGKDSALVGFFFDYDVTMILRDIIRDNPDVLIEMMKPREERKGKRAYVKWRTFDIQYVPRKHLKVKRYGANSGNAVTIHDTRTFFQTSFVNALRTFGVGESRAVEEIEAMKKRRDRFKFPDDADDIYRYCKQECMMLADLVGELRDRFVRAKLSPWPYEGPGPVAGNVLRSRGMKESELLLPTEVHDYARRAYYGGRFETLAHGTLATPVWEYDIKSAYPAAMLRLPCLEHGTWLQYTGVEGMLASEFTTQRETELWVGPIEWEIGLVDQPGLAGPLPWRFDDGAICFPTRGKGVYWSVEIPDYARIVGPVWVYVKNCDCVPFKWVSEMYYRRQAMERDVKGSGLPLKLVLNSLYGKLAQRIGRRPYYNPVWAGLITAYTRHMVYDVYKQHPVVMFATDAVFTTEPCPELELGDRLGQWEEVGPYRDLTIFQPGVYFDEDAAKFKTRGVPYGEFRARSSEFIDAANNLGTSVRLQLTNHLGIRQTLAWGPTRYHDLGNWLPAPRSFTAYPGRKRRVGDDGELYRMGGLDRWSLAPIGTLDMASTPYDHKDRKEAGQATALWEDGLTDYVDVVGMWDRLMLGGEEP
jgi:hypothetical protein